METTYDPSDGPSGIDIEIDPPSPPPFETRKEWRTQMRYFVTDHQPPYLVSTRDVRFGLLYPCFDPDNDGWGDPEPTTN